MNELVNALVFVRLLAEVTLVPICFWSFAARVITSRRLTIALMVFFVTLFMTSFFNFFLHPDHARLFIAFVFTPALLLVVGVWLVALAKDRNGRPEAKP